MDSKKAKIPIIVDGTAKELKEWNKADALFFCEVLKRDRTDLYDNVKEVLQNENHVPTADVGYCHEPMPEGYGKRQQERIKKSSFHSILNEKELEALADLSNDLEVFAEPRPVTPGVLAAFFRMESIGLRVKKLRILCAMLSSLASYGFITYNWQSPIYTHRLLRAFKKDGYLNRSDLSTANGAIHTVLMDERMSKIGTVIKKLRLIRDGKEKH